MTPQSAHCFEFSGFRLDTRDRVLLHGTTRVPLTPTAIETLIELLARAGEAVSRRRLLERVWPGTTVSDATLTQNVYTLRRALAEIAGDTTFIETVPRVGYRFVVPVLRVASNVTAGDEARGRSVAVLPFIALGTDGDGGRLGLALADALIGRLSGVRGLSLRPTSAILRYDGRTIEPFRAARELRVDLAVQGTIQQLGSRLRVAVQLVGVDEAETLWAETFDADATDLFEMQDRISRRLADALSAKLVPDSRRVASHAIELDTEAHQEYVRGRFHWNQRTAHALRQAVECFDRALARQPAYARALAGRADALSLQPLHDDADPHETFPRARTDAERALALDDGLAEAHAALAYVRMFYDWHWAEAEDGFRRAIELDPTYATACHWYGFLLAARGRHDESTPMLERALELDPVSLPINVDLGLTHYFARRFDAARAALERTLELAPEFGYAGFALALTLAACGELDLAITHARAAAARAPDNTAILAVLGHVLALGGRTDEARVLLERLAASRVPRRASRSALIRVGLGEIDSALDDLERACEGRSRFAVFAAVWPAFDAARTTPRFDALARRFGLVGDRR